MRRHALSLLVAALLLAPAGLAAEEPVDLGMMTRIRDEGFRHSQVMATASYLTDVIGARLTGSPALRRANEWTRDRLSTWGLANAHLEAWEFGRGWSFSAVSVAMVAPDRVPLSALPRAWTPGTDGPIHGPAIKVAAKSPVDLDQFKGKVAGKILLIDDAVDVSDDGKPRTERYDADGLSELSQFPIPTGKRDERLERARKRWAIAEALREFLQDRGRAGRRRGEPARRRPDRGHRHPRLSGGQGAAGPRRGARRRAVQPPPPPPRRGDRGGAGDRRQGPVPRRRPPRLGHRRRDPRHRQGGRGGDGGRPPRLLARRHRRHRQRRRLRGGDGGGAHPPGPRASSRSAPSASPCGPARSRACSAPGPTSATTSAPAPSPKTPPSATSRPTSATTRARSPSSPSTPSSPPTSTSTTAAARSAASTPRKTSPSSPSSRPGSPPSPTSAPTPSPPATPAAPTTSPSTASASPASSSSRTASTTRPRPTTPKPTPTTTSSATTWSRPRWCSPASSTTPRCGRRSCHGSRCRSRAVPASATAPVFLRYSAMSIQDSLREIAPLRFENVCRRLHPPLRPPQA